MTNQEILEKAIKKAEKNGFDIFYWVGKAEGDMSWWNLCKSEILVAISIELLKDRSYRQLLTDHEFAKALWGIDYHCFSCLDKPTCKSVDGYEECPHVETPNWQFHLQQMVITDNWLEYIKDYL